MKYNFLETLSENIFGKFSIGFLGNVGIFFPFFHGCCFQQNVMQLTNSGAKIQSYFKLQLWASIF